MASKVLIVGATGYIGQCIAIASVSLGHPTYALVRETSPTDSKKSQALESLKSSGIIILQGSLEDHGGLVTAIKNVDVVISAICITEIMEQLKLIKAIKDAGNVKRFLPSEFGVDAEKLNSVEPAKSAFAAKIKIRQAIEAKGIPYTYVSCSFFAGYFLSSLGQFGCRVPPRDKVVIMGDGNTKVVFNKEEDIGTYTMKAIDDPRTLNKTLYIRIPANTFTMNEVVALWEKLIGKKLEKIYIDEEHVLKLIADTPLPKSRGLAIGHACYIRGSHTYFEIGSNGVEASELYPDVKYTNVEEYLDHLCKAHL